MFNNIIHSGEVDEILKFLSVTFYTIVFEVNRILGNLYRILLNRNKNELCALCMLQHVH